MAIKKFILQGLTPNTHIEALRRLFEIPNIQAVIFSVAFVNEDGVRLIEESIRPVADKTKFFAGVRNDITSYQGLARLLALNTSLYIVDTGARNIIFHPKLYFVKGTNKAGLIIGSANLTLGGLNNNIEAGLNLELDLNNAADRDLVEDIESQFNLLLSSDPEHISLIRSDADLMSLKVNGRLLDESESFVPRPVVTTSNPSDDPISRIRLAVQAIRSTIRRRAATPHVSRVPRTRSEQVERAQTHIATNLELVWQSKPLTERDLNIPEATGTHATGSMNLDKGLLDEDIDHRHYFRDNVFSHLQWIARTSASVEEAEAHFQLVIKGVFYGEFNLQIRHTISTTSASYTQRNAMTRLSWGPMREFIAQRDLIDRTLSLYQDKSNLSRFVLEID